MVYDTERQAWIQPSRPGVASHVCLLQNRDLALDVTDRGLTILPLLLDGRYLLRVGFRVTGAGRVRHLGMSDLLDDGQDDPQRAVYRPGAMLHEAGPSAATPWSIRYAAVTDEPFVSVELILDQEVAHDATVTPLVLWMPGSAEPTPVGPLLRPAQAPPPDQAIEKNHSELPDPPRPDGLTPAALGIVTDADGGDVLETVLTRRLTPARSVIVSDRWCSSDELEILELTPQSLGPDGSLRILIAVTADAAGLAHSVERWRQLSRDARDTRSASWDRLGDRLRIGTPEPEIDAQVPFSLHYSVFSRTRTSDARAIFVHGRRDRGYADSALVFQSYQMHFPALAAGQGAWVREELLAYAATQDDEGSVARSLRPGGGWHPYAGNYCNSHLLMATHRYLSWTGDWSLLDEQVESVVDGRGALRFAERLVVAADMLLRHRQRGLVEPCGWCDGWPADVQAQGQGSAAAVIGLRQFSEVLDSVGRAEEARRYEISADEIGRHMRELLLDPATGIFAESLYPWGAAGGDPGDFWAITQVWPALAGVSTDLRGLDHCRRACLQATGMQIVTESSYERPHMVGGFTDSYGALTTGFTATWLLAIWPEVSHLYGLAEVRSGRPDHALDVLRRQLPSSIHAQDASASPFFYAEKYLYPYTVPWLCTWGGDPLLIQLLLEGFAGVHAALGGLTIAPCLPTPWRDEGMSARFVWRDRPVDMTILPGSGRSVLNIDGSEVDPGSIIAPAMLRSGGSTITVR
jgi:hypothetical protein